MTISKWVRSEDSLNASDGTATTPRPGGPLKPRLDAVQGRIEAQIQRLEEMHKALRSRDEESVKRLVAAIKENNVQCSTILSSDLAKARQTSRIVALSKIALEKLVARLGAISDFGDLVVVLSPAMSVVKIAELLSGILIDAGQVGGYTINFESANEEGGRLIDEAATLVEQQMREEFSGIPDIQPIIPLTSGLV
jgi:hypothetical protein